MNTVRGKFHCHSIDKDRGGGVAVARFSPVYSGSPENEAFWKATPGGELTVYHSADHGWEVGKEYYLDITPAE